MKTLLNDFFNSGTEAQQNKKRMTALVLCATAVILAIALLVLAIGSIAVAIKDKAPNDDEGESGGTKIPNGYTTTTFDAAQLSTGSLLLLDADHPYAGTSPSVVLFRDSESRPKTESGDVVYSIGGTDKLSATSETVEAFNAMITAFYTDETVGGDDCLYISSAYDMTGSNQKSELYKVGTVIALSYYVDYNSDPTNIQTIYGVEKYDWIYENAHTYGFIQASSEEGKENIFRYVGPAHATYMHNNSKTFAEYLTIIQNRTYKAPLQITAKNSAGENVSYSVYYLATGSDMVVPTKYAYEVSGDNMGGYIITIDKSKTLTK
ncbi:MAG: hypothetical protein IJY47_04915 [Clostridia bacterium]|nr:hypothetical protein [Clostridia bacterium]